VDAKFLISGNSTFSFKQGERVWTPQMNERVVSKKAKVVEVEGEGYHRVFTPESWKREMGKPSDSFVTCPQAWRETSIVNKLFKNTMQLQGPARGGNLNCKYDKIKYVNHK